MYKLNTKVGPKRFCLDRCHSIYLRYNTEFGFTIPDRPIMVDDIRIRGVGTAVHEVEQSIEKANGPPQKEMVNKSKYFNRKKQINK